METYKPFNRIFARQMRKESTRSEILLWMHLRKSQMGYPFKRQVPIGPYIVDFYAPRLHIAAEVDGSVHENEDAWEYDDKRTSYLKEKHNIDVLRVGAWSCENFMPEVITLIEDAIKEQEEKWHLK
ncbi:MAG: DUF559 domain-containing protein [Bacteroides sp.]|nr:DUF559 domain-containing protein [Bacteroides sp.]